MKTLILAILLVAPMTYGAGFEKGFNCYQIRDYDCALREWKPLADQGDASARSSLGAMYANGQGVKRDYFEAVKWYRKAADQGLGSVQHNLRVMHENQ